MSIVTYDDLDTPVFEIDFLRYLFANGAQGSVWGLLPYYSDAAGTVEADWGDPVGFIPDASGNEQDWAQVTSTARPILGRVPVGGRRNLLRRTEQLDNAAWLKVGATIVSNAVTAPDGTLSADKIVETAAIGNHATRVIGTSVTLGVQYTYSVYAKAAERSKVSISRVDPAGFSGTGAYYFDLTDGTVSSPPTADDYGIDDVGDGWYRCWITKTCTDTTAQSGLGVFATDAAGSLSYAGDGTSGIYIWGAQLETGSVETPYQRVGNEYDITEAGVKGIHYLRFDGTDDQVTTTLPAISGGTIVLAGTNGIWIDSLDFAGGAFSVGPGAYTGGPDGLLPILGDLLVGGGFVIDRALTPEEIAKVKGYYKARGSAGLFQFGPELVVNGTFDSDTSSWISLNNGVLSVSSQRLSVQSDGTSAPGARQDVTGASGQVLMLQTRLWRGTTNPLRAIEATVVHTGVTVNLVHATDGALLRGVYVAPEASGWIRIRAASTSTAGEIFYADDVSLRPLTLVTP